MNTDSLQTVIDSLHQIVTKLPNEPVNYLAWFLAFTTFAAIFVTPYFHYKNVKKQIHASTVTTNRKEWINMLRDTIAEYITIAFDSVYYYDNLDKNQSDDFKQSLISELSFYQYKIELLLINAEGDSQKIKGLIKEIFRLTFNPSVKETSGISRAENYAKLEKELVFATQKILKEEWERIKQGI